MRWVIKPLKYHCDTDTQAPTIVKVEPGDQITDVPLSYPVRVELSEPIAESSLDSQGFYVQCKSAGEKLAGTIALAGSIFTFTLCRQCPGCGNLSSIFEYAQRPGWQYFS